MKRRKYDEKKRKREKNSPCPYSLNQIGEKKYIKEVYNQKNVNTRTSQTL